MDIIITNSSGEPIYLQITSQIKDMIMRGEVKEGDALPSMRNLAAQLRISVITTKRAYEDLEREGFIESYSGKGSFVCGAAEKMHPDLEPLWEALDEAVMQLQKAGVSRETIINRIRQGGENND